MVKKYILLATKVLLILFLVWDGYVSLKQFYGAPMDGDLANVVVPSTDYSAVFADPLGVKAIQGHYYPGPGRYVAFVTARWLMLYSPLVLQQWVNPVDSVYLAASMIKLMIQLGLIWTLLALAGAHKLKFIHILALAALMSSLFQGRGYWPQMGMIDSSITYTLFYALPLWLLGLYFLLFRFTYARIKARNPQLVYGLLLGLPIPLLIFNGPLNPAVLIIFSLTVLLYHGYFYVRQATLESTLGLKGFLSFTSYPIVIVCVGTGLLGLYNLYVSGFNVEQFWATLPLKDRFMRLPRGLAKMIVGSPGNLHFLATAAVVLSAMFLQSTDQAKALKRKLFWVGIACFLYVVLLPFGGYRSYRPDIIRWDTFLPVWLCIISAVLMSLVYFIQYGSRGQNALMLVVGMVLTLHLTVKDQQMEPQNLCERDALWHMARTGTSESPLELQNHCSVLAWGLMYEPFDSRFNAQLIYQWNITQAPFYYFQKGPDPDQ